MAPSDTWNLLLLLPLTLPSLTHALNCDAPLPGTPNTTYTSNSTPCLLRCHDPLSIATGTLLPGSINSTAIPYCYLDCVHSDATPAQSALAPECSSACEGSGHAGNIEVLGWCVYWCVDGFQEEVLGTECVPRWAYVPITTVVGGRTETVTILTNPAEYTTTTSEGIHSASDTRSARSDASTTDSPETTSEPTRTTDASTASSIGSDDEISQPSSTSTDASAVADSAEPTMTDNIGTAIYPASLGFAALFCIFLSL
ncbi:hypothetical protein BJX68DRAFT_246753 [Aspergillus pseudodeflectus]|uniref:WSC domain-containing protein n=1 Tax=Aspergillus pseudodeflectus TaxID=176178 RepID=A0ABR4JK08_9EURO